MAFLGMSHTEKTIQNLRKIGKLCLMHCLDQQVLHVESGILVLLSFFGDGIHLFKPRLDTECQYTMWVQDLTFGRGKAKNKEDKDKVFSKLSNVVLKRHIEIGKVLSPTNYFGSPKGKNDTLMVCNSMSCALNTTVWTPNFCMPLVESITGSLKNKSYFDLWEMFLNFPIDEKIQLLTDTDLNLHFDGDFLFSATWRRRARTLMGFLLPPHMASTCHYIAKELIRGNLEDKILPLWQYIVYMYKSH